LLLLVGHGADRQTLRKVKMKTTDYILETLKSINNSMKKNLPGVFSKDYLEGWEAATAEAETLAKSAENYWWIKK
jgi:hypothetical protein